MTDHDDAAIRQLVRELHTASWVDLRGDGTPKDFHELFERLVSFIRAHWLPQRDDTALVKALRKWATDHCRAHPGIDWAAHRVTDILDAHKREDV